MDPNASSDIQALDFKPLEQSAADVSVIRDQVRDFAKACSVPAEMLEPQPALSHPTMGIQQLAAAAIGLAISHAPPEVIGRGDVMREPPHIARARAAEERINAERRAAHNRRVERYMRERSGVYILPEPTTPGEVDFVTALRVRRQLNQLKRAATGAIKAAELLDKAFEEGGQ